MNGRATAMATLLTTVLVTLTACSSNGGDRPAATPTSSIPVTTPDPNVGTVRGILHGAGGGGIVLVTGAGGRRYSTSAGADGRFQLRLPPGRYDISARSYPLSSDGRIDCTAARPTIVTARRSTSLSLNCAAR
ncbi:MAG TPA: hypothetical protein VL119_10150 [Acidimicrobiia bacterium]|nr:hypothetical protein [Acidimicrobiia bacterium]